MPQRVNEWNQHCLITVSPVAVQSIVVADDSFGAPFANYEGLAAAPAGLGTAVRQVRADFAHLTTPY
jgi:hypothetical protein